MEKQGAKQVVSIRVSPHIYRQLKSEVGKGRISAFIERLITRELKEQKKNLAQECQAASQDKKRLKEAQAWETAQMTDWDKWDGGEKD